MHPYQDEAAKLLENIIQLFGALDRLSEKHEGQKLDDFGPLTARLAGIRADLMADSRMLPAIRKTNELRMRLLGGLAGIEDPKYRSALAAILGSYQRNNTPAKARLGGLRGGRPRKDGLPTRTLERKGYTPETLPPSKAGRLRVHPAIV